MGMSLNSDCKYKLERTDDVSVLSNFFCGIAYMDNFIHNDDGLKLFVEARLTNLWIVRQENDIIGFFALSKGSLVLSTQDICDVKSESNLSFQSLIKDVDSCPALRIDYLAIRKDYRGRGIGSGILDAIRQATLEDKLSSTLFLIVDAYDTNSYSSVGFYRKNFFKMSDYGLTKNQNKMLWQGINPDTKLMYLPLFPLHTFGS